MSGVRVLGQFAPSKAPRESLTIRTCIVVTKLVIRMLKVDFSHMHRPNKSTQQRPNSNTGYVNSGVTSKGCKDGIFCMPGSSLRQDSLLLATTLTLRVYTRTARTLLPGGRW